MSVATKEKNEDARPAIESKLDDIYKYDPNVDRFKDVPTYVVGNDEDTNYKLIQNKHQEIIE